MPRRSVELELVKTRAIVDKMVLQVEGLLRRWIRHNQPGMAGQADVIDLTNERLADRDWAIGPSFFFVAGLGDAPGTPHVSTTPDSR